MSAAEGDSVRRRRPRYRGTHPRRFEEKYKELAPERYPELVAHVRARGMTPAGQHVPILVDEVLRALAPKPGERGVDCTLGYGGHTRALLSRILPGGSVCALDVDPRELAKTAARLSAEGFGDDVLRVKRTNFAGVVAVLGELGWHDGVDFVFADLGVSSMQIDDPARGFTFKHDGPLDMRMHPTKGRSAAEWLASASAADVERILVDHADEPRASRLARALVARRGELGTTRALADAVRAALPPRTPDEESERTLRRVFQALRIAVNDEFGALDALLRQLPNVLRPGGRAAFLTFHSGEDRRVKHAFARGLADGTFRAIADEPVRPSPEERRENPRSAPAKLRWARKA
ncbi:MAG: 16S rRNA (cytosine(1402)-N(4))-methyltransferase RsmH [Planctomycetes bacterium]|nr:16S rRNA (cytosine(1402)-N(4))-methyltransferase RsmH [Planctomycetota bacterium]